MYGCGAAVHVDTSICPRVSHSECDFMETCITADDQTDVASYVYKAIIMIVSVLVQYACSFLDLKLWVQLSCQYFPRHLFWPAETIAILSVPNDIAAQHICGQQRNPQMKSKVVQKNHIVRRQLHSDTMHLQSDLHVDVSETDSFQD